jgi:hypothetical protein
MIITTIPYSTSQNLGEYYNWFMENCVPNDEDFACFVDRDAMFTSTYYHKDLEDLTNKYNECGLFSCVTNRVGSEYQRLFEPDSDRWKNNDMAWHMTYGLLTRERHFSEIIDVSKPNGAYLSGVVILIRKREWKQVGGFKDTGMLGIDSDIHERFVKKDFKVHILKGVYLYHWYRGGVQKSKEHLTKKPVQYIPDSKQHKLNINKARICVYSAVFGEYEQVKNPLSFSKNLNIDYHLFTDNKQLNTGIFNRIHIDLNDSPVRKARYIKTQIHNILTGYDIYFWIDGSMRIIKDLDTMLEPFIHANYHMAMIKHWDRNCLYHEASIVKSSKIDKDITIDKQISRYRKEGFPAKFGLTATGIMIRRNTEFINSAMNQWWNEINTNSHRDQLSFDYIRWKYGIDLYHMERKFVIDNYFQQNKHK